MFNSIVFQEPSKVDMRPIILKDAEINEFVSSLFTRIEDFSEINDKFMVTLIGAFVELLSKDNYKDTLTSALSNYIPNAGDILGVYNLNGGNDNE